MMISIGQRMKQRTNMPSFRKTVLMRKKVLMRMSTAWCQEENDDENELLPNTSTPVQLMVSDIFTESEDDIVELSSDEQ